MFGLDKPFLLGPFRPVFRGATLKLPGSNYWAHKGTSPILSVLAAFGRQKSRKKHAVTSAFLLKSHQKVLQMDSLWRLKQAIFYRARPIEGSERSCSVHAPHGYKHPQLCQIFVLSIVAPPAHPIRHKSELQPYHPQEENRLAQHGLSQASEMHWNDKYNGSLDVQSQTTHAKTSRMEGCIGQTRSSRKPWLGHHFWEELCGSLPQIPGCMKFLHPWVECYIVRSNLSRKQRLGHHFWEALCDTFRQIPGSMRVLHPNVEFYIVHLNCSRKQRPGHHFWEAPDRSLLQIHPRAECNIVHNSLSRKQWLGHHFWEALCDTFLQRPGSTRVLHPNVECYIVHRNLSHKQRLGHHFWEELCGLLLHKPGCMKAIHPEAECCIVHLNCSQMQQLDHHFWEALSEICLQIPGCTKVLHPMVLCCIAHQSFYHKQPLGHHFSEALCDNLPQIPRSMRVLHPRAEFHIVHLYCDHKQQLDHHFSEELCDKLPQMPSRPDWSPNVFAYLPLVSNSRWVSQMWTIIRHV